MTDLERSIFEVAETRAGHIHGSACTCSACLERDFVGHKDDERKDPMHLLPPRAIVALARVLGHGARKYGAENWRRVAHPRERYLAALLRHVFAYLDDEILDGESGHPHMAHVMANAAFLVEREGE